MLIGVFRGALRQFLCSRRVARRLHPGRPHPPTVGDYLIAQEPDFSRHYAEMLAFVIVYVVLIGLAVIVIQIGGRTIELSSRPLVDEMVGGVSMLVVGVLILAGLLIALDTLLRRTRRGTHGRDRRCCGRSTWSWRSPPSPTRCATRSIQPSRRCSGRSCRPMFTAPADAPAAAPLAREFFNRPTEDVARDLLGVWLLRTTADGVCGGPIVETEAYGGPEDLASHARAGLTRRTTPMFGEAGHAYVYLVYGMHECLNVVATRAREAGAVLIRRDLRRARASSRSAERRGRPTDPTTGSSAPARPALPGPGRHRSAGRP